MDTRTTPDPAAATAQAPAPGAPAARVHRRRMEDLPGPPGLPWVGNALQLDAPRLHQQLEAWADRYGPMYRLRLGSRRIVVVGDHTVVAAVLRDRPDGFRRTTRLEQMWTELGLPPGVFGANGEAWRRQRRMVMAGFDPAHVRSYFPSMQQVAARLARRWQQAAREQRAIDLQADLMRFTVDTIAGLAFGAEVDTLGSEGDVIQQHLDKLFPALFKRILAVVPTWRMLPSEADRALARSIGEVLAAVQGFIAQARARMAAEPQRRAQPANLLEAMIAAADAPGSGIDDELVAGNVLTMLLAGEDTTANTLAWMIHLLWRNPDTLARATEEVRRVCGDASAPGFAQMAELDYLEACAHETMRLKPVAPQLPLQAEHDVVVGDVLLPAGTIVINMLRRDGVSEAHVPDATQFKPERWLGGDGPAALAASAKRTSMPFGAGPRICPGRYLALLEMKIAMATLLGRFDISAVDTPDGQEAQEHLAFTMAPVGLTMRLRERP
ncbi:MAG: cytochrome P450 [Burkholderiales bacterium]|nr:cytochrome P450 [Burkholderiales bacterium]